MTERAFVVLLAAGALVATGCGDAPRPDLAAVVLITLDTTRADRLGCYGNASIETPVLDGLAAGGVLFERASAVTPLTLPSHASMMTGRYPGAHGVRNNGMYALPEAERTLAEAFAAAGYDTAAFVAAYPVSSPFGLAQGFEVFDETFGAPRADSGYFYAERDAAAVTEAASAWLAGRRDAPFFLWVHYFDPHARYEAPEPFRSQYAANPYDGEIAWMDSRIGALLDAVRAAAPPERTVIAVAGDHGEGLGEHEEATHGLFVYESTIRVPMILHAPGRLPSGVRVPAPVSLVDLSPTLLDLTGLSAGGDGDGPPVQGASLLPFVDAARAGPAGRPGSPETARDRPVISESLVAGLEYGWSPLHAVRTLRWKYIDAPRPELYDLAEDPGEVTNLAGDPSSGETRARLREALERLREEAAGAALEAGADRPLDPETLERLRSLGYLQGGGGGAGGGEDVPREDLVDPKDRIGFFEGLNRAGMLARQGDTDGAIAACRALLDEDPGNPAALRRLSEILAAAGRWDDLGRLLGPVHADAARERAGPSLDWVPGFLGRAVEEAGDRDAAIALYRDARLRDPDGAKYGVRAAILLHEGGRTADALAEIEETLRANPRSADALNLAADLEEASADAGAALAFRRRALEAAPDDPRALAALGVNAFENGSYAEAAALFARLETAAPGDADAPLYRGAIAVVEERYGEAVGPLRRAEDLAPDRDDVRYWLGTALVMTGDLEGAERRIEALAAARPEAFQTQRALGRLRLEQGRSAEAAAAFRRALEINPEDAVSRRLLDRIE